MDAQAHRVELDDDTAVDEPGCRTGESVDLGQSVFEQLGVGVVHSTMEGRLTYVNPKFCELLGYSRREASMLSIRELTHADDIGSSVEARRHLVAGTGSLLREGSSPVVQGWSRDLGTRRDFARYVR